MQGIRVAVASRCKRKPLLGQSVTLPTFAGIATGYRLTQRRFCIMASKYWLKLYHEILSDPKMGVMSDRLWRRTVECFLAAGDEHNGGELPELAVLAYRLRMHPEELEADLVELQKTGILSSRDGKWYVTNFSERQRASTGAERAQRYRDRKRKENYYGNDTLRDAVPDKIRLDKDKIRLDKIVFCPECKNKVLEENLGQDCKMHAVIGINVPR